MTALNTTGERTLAQIGSFTTEAGVTIPEVTLAYQAWGTYRGDNLVLVEHALTGDSDVASWWGELLGPGKPLDTDQYCIVCTNALGGCQGSTGPSSIAPDGAAWGSRFPALSIRDLVRVEKQFCDQFGWHQIRAIIGGSMGGARTLEWTLLYPEMLGSALVFAVSARASAWQIGIQTAQIDAITADPNWHGGDYYQGDRPNAGLAAARRIAHLTYRGELEIDERFGTDAQPGENPLAAYRRMDQRFAVQSYLEHQGRKLTTRFDAGSYVILTEALNRHDIGRDRGGLNKALASCQVPTMIAGVDTDILYPYHQQEHLSRNIGSLLAMAKISSPVGHDAFLSETRQVGRIIRHFFLLAAEEADDDGLSITPAPRR